MTAEQLIALVAIVVGATSTVVTAYLAHRRASADREHGRQLAQDERAHTLRLARDDRLFASRREVYEEALRLAKTMTTRCQQEFNNVAGHVPAYVLVRRGMLNDDEVTKHDNPIPERPTPEQHRQLEARLGTVGSRSVEGAFLTLEVRALAAEIATARWDQVAREHAHQPEEEKEAKLATEALEEAEAAMRELAKTIREELTGREEQTTSS